MNSSRELLQLLDGRAETGRDTRELLSGATVTETPGSHAVYVSNPAVVAGLIAQAARSALTEPALA